MKTFITTCTAITLLLLTSTFTFSQKIKIADDVAVNISTSHPYSSLVNRNEDGVVFEQEFYKQGASYVALHFKNFDLAEGDYVEIYSNTNQSPLIYKGKGKKISAKEGSISDFWTGTISSDKAIVKLHSQSPSSNYGFDIDIVAYGHPENAPVLESICGSDDKDEAICHSGTDMYKKAHAICKLIISGRYLCTGWLLGSDGHVMTNNHCIENAEDAQNTEFIFNYEYTNCNGTGNSTSDVIATSSTLIKTSTTYDYSLVKLPTNPTSKYGYLSFRSTIPEKGERIYIPQHPNGVRKQIAVIDDQSTLPGKYASIVSNSSSRVTYAADTYGGSSGSPVLSFKDNLVVTLHNSGSCEGGNGGNRNDQIIKDLGSLMPSNGVDSDGGNGGGDNQTPTCSDGIKNGDETGVDCGGSCPNSCHDDNDDDDDNNGGDHNCPTGYTYYACERCWVDKAQAISGGCNESAFNVTSIENGINYTFSISNPVSSKLKIHTNYSDKISGTIMTIDGIVVKKFEMVNNYEMNVSKMCRGVYVVFLQTDSTMPVMKKIMVKE